MTENLARDLAEALALKFTSDVGARNSNWDIDGPDDASNPYHLTVPMEQRIERDLMVTFKAGDGHLSLRPATIPEVVNVALPVVQAAISAAVQQERALCTEEVEKATLALTDAMAQRWRLRQAWQSARRGRERARIELHELIDVLPCDHCHDTGIEPAEFSGHDETGAFLVDEDRPCPKGCEVRRDIAEVMAERDEARLDMAGLEANLHYVHTTLIEQLDLPSDMSLPDALSAVGTKLDEAYRHANAVALDARKRIDELSGELRDRTELMVMAGVDADDAAEEVEDLRESRLQWAAEAIDAEAKLDYVLWLHAEAVWQQEQQTDRLRQQVAELMTQRDSWQRLATDACERGLAAQQDLAELRAAAADAVAPATTATSEQREEGPDHGEETAAKTQGRELTGSAVLEPGAVTATPARPSSRADVLYPPNADEWCNCQAIPGTPNYPGPWHPVGDSGADCKRTPDSLNAGTDDSGKPEQWDLSDECEVLTGGVWTRGVVEGVRYGGGEVTYDVGLDDDYEVNVYPHQMRRPVETVELPAVPLQGEESADER
jgi:hypothetical protein